MDLVLFSLPCIEFNCPIFILCRDFISTSTLRIEAGLAQETEQYETNRKARQLMGGVDGDSYVQKPFSSGKGSSISGTSRVLASQILGGKASQTALASPTGRGTPAI